MQIFIALIVAICYQSATLNGYQKSTWESPTYTAAVVEYSPLMTADDSFMLETIYQNVINYKPLINNAKKSGADIVVFPEYGLATLNGLERNRKEIIPIASVIPDPRNKTNPCILSSSPSVISTLKEVSCLAKMNEIYVVINLFEKVMCSYKTDPDCPTDNVYLYNSNVVFDRDGAVVARYRKFNLFNETVLNRTSEPELATFLSDFGVRFGLIIGSDILYKSPALDLVHKEKITDIILTTSLPSELPFTSSIQVPFGWSFANGINVIMAGYNSPELKRTGSGIFAGRNGILISLLTPMRENQVLVKRVDKLTGRIVRQVQNETDCFQNQVIPELYNKMPKHMKESFLDFKTYQEQNVTAYKTEILRTMVADHITQHCSHGFCCYFRIKIHIQKRPDYIYRMVAFNGVRPLLGSNRVGVQLCAVVACTDQSLKSCGKREKITKKPLLFHEIEIRALYPKSKNFYQYPTTLQYNMMPLFVQNFSYCEVNKSNGKQAIIKTNDPISHLLVFGLYGRNTLKDGQTITNAAAAIIAYYLPLVAATLTTIIASLLIV